MLTTPGPWTARVSDPAVPDGAWCVIDPDFHCVSFHDGDFEQGDAHLIAAAPDMLTALEEVVRCLSWHEEKHGVGMDKAAILAAQAAIAKAYGRKP